MHFATTPDEVRALTDAAIAEADDLVAAAVATGGAGSFETVLLPFDEADARLAAGYAGGAFMSHVHVEAAVRDAGQEADERLNRWRVDLLFRDDVAATVATFAASPGAAALTGERRRLLDRLGRDLRRAGHGLEPATRSEVRSLQGRLVELESAFQRNIDEAQDGLDLTRDELDGLADDFVAGLRPGAVPGTFRVSLDAPELYPFLGQARRRDLRRDLERREFNQAREANEPLLAEALRIRRRIADLLGYPSWAHYAMEVKMAHDPEAVRAFYDGIVPPLRAAMRGEVARLEEILRSDGEDRPLRTWDWRYCDSRLRRRDYAVDPDELRGYLPLRAVLDGLLGLTGEVFGLVYEPAAAAAWHPDVHRFRVRDAATGAEIGDILMDLHPREGKYGHAAAWALTPGRRLPRWELPAAGHRHRRQPAAPHRRRPGPPAPRGRGDALPRVRARPALHPRPRGARPVLGREHRVGLRGGAQPDPGALGVAAGRAGEVRAAPRNGRADPGRARRAPCREPRPRRRPQTLRQCYLGMVDLLLHGAEETVDIADADRAAFAATWGLPYHEGTLYPCQFGHLLGGYDAGYYGYLWAKVYGDDMFGRFEREGVTSTVVGADYRREILEPNGTRDPLELLRAFLGREPSPGTFLRLLGIEAASAVDVGAERATTP